MQFLVFGVIVAAVLTWLFGKENFELFLGIGLVSPVFLVIGWWWLSSAAEKSEERFHLQRWNGMAEPHMDALVLRYRQIVAKNPYGGVDLKPWRKELDRFRTTAGIWGKLHLIAVFDRELTARVKDLVATSEAAPATKDFTSTDPYEYERWCAQLLRAQGWDASATQASGDQGVDVIATKGGHKVAIQCKLHMNAVGNKAIQEIHAAAAFVDASHAVVVAPGEYTRAARQLAGKVGVLLLHHSQLAKLDELIGVPRSVA
ncbi:restriction endonuclease [Mesorhizobium sp. B2-3-3]|nr:restriction endonuclease [Mesorhizobium sp. B2-3-3]